ncbi:excisionase [Achromobacter denitrificans]|nr:excisionase [Achromobacter denitrificans]
MVRFVTIARASELTGYSEQAIRSKIRDDIWREGKEWIRAPDGRILIDMEGYDKWVETDAVLKPPQKAVSKSRSNTRGGGVVSGFLSSPRPLI